VQNQGTSIPIVQEAEYKTKI